MDWEFDIAGRLLSAALERKGAGTEMAFRGRRYRAALHTLGEGEVRLELDGVSHRAWLVVRGDTVHVHAGGAAWTLRRINPLEKLAGSAGGAGTDTAEAPMPGTVVRVEVRTGEAVRRGRTLMVIESMKLETSINAWRDGVVAAIHQEPGATFDRRAPLVSLEPVEPG